MSADTHRRLQLENLTVIGGSRGLGREIVNLAADDGCHVLSVSRRGRPLDEPLSTPVRWLMGDIVKEKSGLAEVSVSKAEAVVISLGHTRSFAYPHNGKVIRSAGTQAVIEAMKNTGARRLVVVSCQTSAKKWVRREHELQEALVQASDLDWTIVRPAKFTEVFTRQKAAEQIFNLLEDASQIGQIVCLS